MLLKRGPELPYSSVTPKGAYLSRRRFFGSASASDWRFLCGDKT